ncbi:MAG: LysM peptidoglycan-binding domain-containing protein, partial [Steroidobacteraceae bacterium]
PPAALLAANAGPGPGLPGSYRVQPGDTLSGIAARYGVSTWALARLNGIDADGILRIGERLRLPGPGEPAPLPAGIVARAARPSSIDKVEARGPGLGPGGHSAPSLDPTDYSVGSNDTIRVAAAESLGYYAEWLGVSAMDLRRINHLRVGQSLWIGERIRLDFRHVTPAQFEQQRVAYHRALEARYFATHRIDGVFYYVTRSGDSLWTLMQRFPGLPEWLLRQYNPHIDFFALKPGTRLVVPRIEAVAAGS